MMKKADVLFKKILAIFLLMSLTMIQCLYVMTGIVTAVYEELDSQNTNIENTNVYFDVYYEDGKHSKQLKISDGGNVYSYIKIENSGVLNDAKIHIDSPNFKIDTDNIDKKYIQSIDLENNDIVLNQIATGERTIKLPIKFERKDNISSNYFDKKNNFTLSANYKSESKKEMKIEKSIDIATQWTDDVDINIENDFSKFQELDKDSTLLEQVVKVSTINKNLPKQEENLELEVPILDKVKPSKIVVLHNGMEINSNYDKESAKLSIQYKNDVTENGQIIWGSEKDTYKVIYVYDGKINVKQRKQLVKGIVSTKYYTRNDAIQKSIEEEKNVNVTADIVSADMTATDKIAKQYFTVKSSKRAYIDENSNIEIPEISQVNDFSLEIGNTAFDNEKGVSTNVDTFLEKTYINKERVLDIFGQDVKIEILNQDNQIITTIDSSSETEGDNFIVNYPENIKKATIKFTKNPVKNGEIIIGNRKYFNGNINIDQKQLDGYTCIKNQINVLNKSKVTSFSVNTNLAQAEEKIDVALNNTNLSTSEINKSVEIQATLKTKDYQNALYKNPTVEIVFPNQVKSVNVNSIKLLYENELKIEKAEGFNREDGKYEIKLTLSGMQSDYKKDEEQEATFVVNTDLELYKDISSFVAPISVIVENDGYEAKSFDVQINGIARSGLFSYSKVEGYNDNEISETLGSDVNNIVLPAKQNSKNIKRTVDIINNNDFDVQNVVVEGSLSCDDENGKVKLSYLDKVSNIANVTYSYESTGENWFDTVNDFSKVKRFKINIGNMTSMQVIKFEYYISVPEQLDGNLNGYMQEVINYDINGQNLKEESKTTVSVLSTSNEQVTVENNNDSVISSPVAYSSDDLGLEYVAKNGTKEIKDGDEVFNGEVISYHVKITNNTKDTISGINVVATQENAVFYNQVKVEGQDPITYEPAFNYFYREDEECKEINKENITLEAGKTYEFDYEFSVKKSDGSDITNGNIKITANGQDKNYKTLKNTIKDSNIKISVLQNSSTTHTYGPESNFPVIIKVQNMLDKELTNVNLEEVISNGLTLNETFIDGEFNDDVEMNNGIVNLNIPKIGAGETITINQNYIVDSMDFNVLERESTIFVKNDMDGESISSNVLKLKTIQTQSDIQVSYVGNRDSQIVDDGDEIQFNGTVTVNGGVDKSIKISGILSDGLIINDSYITIDGVQEKIEFTDRTFSKTIDVKKGSTISVVINTIVDKENASDSNVESSISVETDFQETIEKSVTYLLKGMNNDDDDDGEPELPEIMGVAWLDANEDGKRDEDEELLKDVTVKLIDAETGKQVSEQQTNEDGVYDFTDLPNGKYIVAFVYNKKMYRVTIYQKDGVDEKENSDVIARTSNGEDLAVTDILDVDDVIVENIDAGFVKNTIFDLSLDKTVSKITLSSGNEKIEKHFKDSKLAKAEINAKKVSNTTVYMEYKIKVTNEGETPGTATDIIDYIPQDVEFDKTLNQSWYQDSDGNLHTTALKNEQINPGESKDVTLILTKKMNGNNMGTTFNTAEIANISNPGNLLDVDSTPGNRNTEEDDFSSADVILSIKTGKVIMISVISVILVAGIIYVIFYIKRGEKYENKK